ncbi:hypothetical protein Tco_1475886 [Tanacetum coccineum]
MIPNPDKPTEHILEPLFKMTEGNKKQYIADVRVMNYLLQAIPNDIYNSMDACKNDKDMWERIKRLMFGSDVTNHVRHSRLMDEFDKFAAKEGESLESVYNLRNRSRIGINKWYQSFALRNFDLEDMEFESTNSGTTAKLPILKLGEYEMWVIRIKQYFQIQDYALWEVIENGDSWVSVPQTAQENGTSVTKMSIPVTAEEKTNKKNDVKARSLLLMALPNEHQLTFSQYPDAK